MLLHLQTVPAGNGLLWVRHGFKVFRRRPLALTGLFGLFLMAGLVLLQIPLLGPVLLVALLPLLSLGFMLATHLVLQNQTPNAAVFLAPLKLTPQRRKTQLSLCLAYAALTLLILLLSQWIDGGSFSALEELLAKQQPNDPGYEQALALALADPRLYAGWIVRLGLAALLAVPFWHAPALVHWGGQGAMQALFSSTLGVWRNKGAFLLNALGWAAIGVGLSLLAGVLGGVLGLGPLLPLVALPAALLLSSVFYASLYFTFVDCFMFGAPREVLNEQG